MRAKLRVQMCASCIENGYARVFQSLETPVGFLLAAAIDVMSIGTSGMFIMFYQYAGQAGLASGKRAACSESESEISCNTPQPIRTYALRLRCICTCELSMPIINR